MSWNFSESFGHATIYTDSKNPELQYITLPNHNYIKENNTMRDASTHEQLLFRQGATKKPSKTNQEIRLLKLELAVLKAVAKLPYSLQFDALAELEDTEEEKEEPDQIKMFLEDQDEPEESETELQKRRKQEDEHEPEKKFDDPEDALFKSETSSRATIEPTYSVLNYKIGSLNFEPEKVNGDKLMRMITDGIEDFTEGDDFLKEIGCGD